MRPSRALSIIVPCYNEAANIERHLRHTHAVLGQSTAGRPYEIIAVDDGSHDDTLVKLRSLAQELPHLRVLAQPHNQGKGAAVKRGVLAARGQVIGYLDADGEISPEYIDRYLPWLRGGADIVVASKAHPRSATQRSWGRHVLSWGFQRLQQGLLGTAVADTQVGLKLFTRAVAQRIFPYLRTRGFLFDLEFIVLAEKEGYRVHEAPVQFRQCAADGGSSVRLGGVGQYLWQLVQVRQRVGQTVRHWRDYPRVGDAGRYALTR